MKPVIFVFSLLFACLPTFAQDSLNVSLAGMLYGSGLDLPVDDVVVQGSYAYVAADGLNIIDINDPAHPVAVSRLSVTGLFANGVSVEGQFAYLAGDGDDLQVINISDPHNPTVVAECDIFNPYEITVHDGVLAVVENNRIRFYDISTPTSPVSMGIYANPMGPRKLVMQGGYAFVACGSNGVRILDISEMGQVASMDADGFVGSVAISGDYLFAGVYGSEIQVYEISDPENPVYRDTVTLPRSPTSMVVDGNYLYVGDHWDDDGYTILDATDPSSPAVISSMTVVGDVEAVAARGSELYIANEEEGLRIIDVSDPYNPSELLTFAGEPEIRAVEGDDTYAYVLTYEDELIVADVSDPHSPFVLGGCSVPNAHRFTVVDRFAYVVAQATGFYVVDLTDPASPSLVATRAGNFTSVAIENGYAYLARASRDQVTIFNVNDPTNPVSVASWNPDGIDLTRLDVSGELALLLVRNGLRIYNVSDLPNAEYVGRFVRWDLNPGFLAASGNIVALGNGEDGIHILDISVPSTPFELCQINTGYSVRDLDIDGDFLYITRNTTGMKIYDIADPSRPELVGQYDMVSDLPVRSVCATGSPFVYGTNKQSLLIFDCTAAKRELMDITLTLDDPVIVPQGGSFTYGAILASNLQSTQLVDIWTDAYLPSGYLYRPNWLIQDVEFTPTTVIENPTVTQTIPSDAPLGIYTFRLNAGHYPGPTIGKDTFRFQVVPANGTDSSVGWTSWGFDAAETTTDVAAATGFPTEFVLSAAWPNPFNEQALVRVALPERGDLTVAVYNVNGQQVATLAQGEHAAGTHTFSLDASGLASGVYFVRAALPGERTLVRKVMLVR